MDDPSEARELEWVALFDAPDREAAEVFDQRCLSEPAIDPSRRRALEARVGDVLNTPLIGLMSQLALDARFLT